MSTCFTALPFCFIDQLNILEVLGVYGANGKCSTPVLCLCQNMGLVSMSSHSNWRDHHVTLQVSKLIAIFNGNTHPLVIADGGTAISPLPLAGSIEKIDPLR
ncbi:hypothetical protein AAZV13_17G139600 [Glycine max]